MVNFGPLGAEIISLVWGTSANFNRFRVLASLLQRRRSTKPTKLGTMFGHLLGWYTIYTFLMELLPPDGILPHVKFTMHPSVAFLYIGSATAWHSHSRHQPNCGVVQGMELLNFCMQKAPPIFGWVAITLGIGPHFLLMRW